MQELPEKTDRKVEIYYNMSRQELIREIIRLEDELAQLRGIFELATCEFKKRDKKIALLKGELERAKAEIKELEKKVELLEKENRHLKGINKLLSKKIFSKKNEKKQDEKQTPENIKPRKKGAVKGHPGNGRKIPKNLPVKEEIVELPENERICSCCGKPLKEIGVEEPSFEVGVKREYYLRKIRRKIYKKTCNCPNPIVTALPSPKLIPKGKFSLEFWVDVLINKYKNHLPIQRQISDMEEYGLIVPKGTISEGLKKIHSKYIKALYSMLMEDIRKADHWHADETGWRLFAKVNDKGNYKWFVWVFISKEIVLFVLHPNRSSEVPLRTLFGLSKNEAKSIKDSIKICEKKRINVDKYSSYKALENMGLVELVFCWAHQRREFIEAEVKYPELTEWTKEWIERIGTLYHINKERIKYKQGEPLFREYDKKLREKIEEMHKLIMKEYSHPGQIAIMRSIRKHWKGLTIFVDNPDIPMDNNLAERMLRGIVLGRKNYYGNHSVWAGELDCAISSIIQTCALHGISPRAYLTYYFRECIKKGGLSSEEIGVLLPHKLSESSKKELEITKPEIFDSS